MRSFRVFECGWFLPSSCLLLLPWGLAPIRLPLIAGGHQRKHPQPSRLRASGTSSGLLVLSALDSKDPEQPRWKNAFYFIVTFS